MTLGAHGAEKTNQNIQELLSKQLLSTLVTQRDSRGENEYMISR